MKKLLAILLVLSMLIPALFSCAQSTENGDEAAQPGTDSGTVTPAEEEEEDPTAALYADLPTGDYGGFAFTFLNNISNFAYTLMSAEELTGEGINDAIFNRNHKVEDTLNIEIAEQLVGYSEVTSGMNAAIAAGDDTYACFWNEAGFVSAFGTSGKLLNVNEISTLNLAKPWWEGAAMNEIQILDKLFYLVGDIHLMFKESFWMCGYNRSLLDQNQLDNPYDLVKEGTWTIDRMKAEMEATAQDLNGDGTMDGNDRFGVTCYSGCFHPFYIAADEVLITRNADGIPENVTLGDRFYAVYEKIVNTMFSADATSRYVCMDGKTQNIAQYENGWHGVFLSGHALFYLEPIGSLKKLRGMDNEFGIVPFPKYDDAQKNYVTYIATYAAMCGIPITNSDPERTGVILENLCAESHGDLRQAYVDTTLNFKYIRDEESKEMLDLILSTGRFNLCDLLAVSAIKDALASNASAGKTEVASAVAKMEKVAAKTLDKALSNILGD
ncbi:MAG: hypothetical protein K6A33_11930 [Clostridiales bacterium]|nr:hypothetical protein [Clostridiales bacterium]